MIITQTPLRISFFGGAFEDQGSRVVFFRNQWSQNENPADHPYLSA
jgi:hypothetical protein